MTLCAQLLLHNLVEAVEPPHLDAAAADLRASFASEQSVVVTRALQVSAVDWCQWCQLVSRGVNWCQWCHQVSIGVSYVYWCLLVSIGVTRCQLVLVVSVMSIGVRGVSGVNWCQWCQVVSVVSSGVSGVNYSVGIHRICKCRNVRSSPFTFSEFGIFHRMVKNLGRFLF
jgi:hypothetical protein